MRRPYRVLAACAVALMCAPGTWLRSEVVLTVPQDIAFVQIAKAGPTAAPSWALEGVWHYDSKGARFGGFSAMLALGPDTLRAFSDRGFRITLTVPDKPGPRPHMNRQFVNRGWDFDLVDAESATRDPESGDYWIAYEQTHAIQRNTIASRPDGVRDLRPLVTWPDNGGVEAMARLDDGRFVILPEGAREGLIFAGDPVAGGAPRTFTFANPVPGYEATDLAQLPNGRLLVLMRKLVWPSRENWPAFSCLLAIGDPPVAGGTFDPQVTLRLDDVIPRENYEGLAVQPRGDGRIDVWVISDDNFSIFQRTLLAKLVFDPKV